MKPKDLKIDKNVFFVCLLKSACLFMIIIRFFVARKKYLHNDN